MSADASWSTLRFEGGTLRLLDQRELPGREAYLSLTSVEEVARAIETMAVRGAPAIGCAAAFGVALGALASRGGVPELRADVKAACERLAATRPTAANLFYALGRMGEACERAAAGEDASAEAVVAALCAEAQRLLEEDLATCRAIGAAGLELVPEGARILTHCNAGALATAGYGTALGVVRAAFDAGRQIQVIADETRPFLQGARITDWELARDHIPVTVVTDAMPAHLMRRGEVDLVLIGADRIARNGDVANKIGSYGLAVLARQHGIPFYVAAPLATIDASIASGEEIPIEERGREEVAELGGRALLPAGVPVRHPAFDVTPAALVDAIVTERGVARAPYEPALAAWLHD